MNETTPAPRGPESDGAAVRRLRHLLDLSVALAVPRSLPELLERILRTTRSALHCEEASVLMVDGRSGTLRFAAATGAGAAALADVRVPIDGSLAGTIVREDRPLLAEDVDRDARHFGGASAGTGVSPRVLLGVPMRLDGRPVGVLEALNPHEGTFDAVDVEVLTAVAAQASVALQTVRYTEALEEANGRLADLDRLKTNFMSIASHEMRTPITAVQGFGQILAEEVSPDLFEHAEAVVRAGDRLMNVVATIDEMAALDEDRQMPLATVDAARILAEVAQKAPCPVALTLPDVPTTVSGDDRRLRLAFANLVQNACQFTPADGEVSVDAEVDADALVVRVRDTGRGLAPSDLERIFEAFYQVADPDTRDHEGLGVGLTVARSVALKHGGRLWAESPGLDQGSTFTLRLPLAPNVG